MNMFSISVELFYGANDRKDAEQLLEEWIKKHPDVKFWRIASIIKYEDKSAPSR